LLSARYGNESSIPVIRDPGLGRLILAGAGFATADVFENAYVIDTEI